MVNFSGSTTRRVVNLGDNRRPRGGNFLLQTQQEHQIRQEYRKKVRAATIIQSYVARFLELRHAADQMAREWLDCLNGDINWDLWAYRFAFVALYASKPLVYGLFPVLTTGIRSLSLQFCPYAVAVLLRSLRITIDREIDIQRIIDCLTSVLDQYRVPVQYPNTLSGFSSRLTGCINSENWREVIKLSFLLQEGEKPENFVLFVASIPPRYAYSESSIINITRKKLRSGTATSKLSTISDEDKILLLANTVRIFEFGLEEGDCTILGTILSTMAFTVKTSRDTSSVVDFGDAKEYSVAGDLKSSLLLLENNAFVAKAVSRLRSWNGNEELLLPHMIKIFPDMRPRLCMACSLSGCLLKKLYVHVSSCAQYSTVKDQALIFDDSRNLAKVSNYDDFGVDFSLLLYSYCVVLSYWLTVTNDQESFDEEFFSVSVASDFTEFLKKMTLWLILKPAFFSWSHFTVSQQRDTSIALLNQLYIKNLRMKFVPRDFWIVRSLQLDKKSMISLLQAEQKRIEEEEDLSSESENSSEETNKRCKLATSAQVPLVEILKKVPFFVDFTDRVEVFRGLVAHEKVRISTNLDTTFLMWDPHFGNLKADIRREFLLKDAFDAFNRAGNKFKHELKVTFHNEYGEEAGIDGGGITKEFLTALVKEAFSPECELALFRQTEKYTLYPNPEIYLKTKKKINVAEQAKKMAYLRFMGMVIGKCLFEGVLIDFRFASFFLSKWRVARSGKSSLDDLADLDENLFNNLIKLMDMSAEQIDALELDFVIEENVDGKIEHFALGATNECRQLVTVNNRLKYIHEMANFKLNQCLQYQTGRFLSGLFTVINRNWLNLFDPFELQMLVSGTNEIDLQDWRKHVNYGGYWESDETIQFFWQVVEEMAVADQQALVKFVTSVSRAPLLGFSALEPKFGISRVPDATRLPTASTCANLLKLPEYNLKRELREKLLYAIHANSGFDLS